MHTISGKCLVLVLHFIFFVLCCTAYLIFWRSKAALELARSMQRFPVEVPESVANGAIGTNFVRTKDSKTETKKGGEGEDPILMLHGFDSSLLEFRRLMPKLEDLGAEAYAVDVLGWGFTELAGVSSFGAGAWAVFRSFATVLC